MQAIPEVPNDILNGPRLRAFLVSMRNAIVDMQQGIQPPDPPSNFTVTPAAGANILNFTRSANAEKFIVYWNSTADFGSANAVDIGLAAQWTDNVGAGAIARYYWIKAKRNSIDSVIVGPQTATTLALGVAITPVEPPVASDQLVVNDQGDLVPGINRGGIGDYL